MAMSLGFLLVVFAALCGMAMVIAVLVMMFRAAASSNSRGPKAAPATPRIRRFHLCSGTTA